jgi:hypothetical protein
MTDVYSMMEGYYTYQCTTIPGMDGPIGSIGGCVGMAKALVFGGQPPLHSVWVKIITE